ncbi:retroviral-like aspartic protease family protein [Candidatus Bipolaricaulota bacterium]|nr:retroviral-like aspartic protease family protein [Candidatus Bipolaricaulota bacterium]
MKTRKQPAVSAFTTSSNRGLRNVLQNKVEITAGFDPKKTSANKQPSFKTFTAIWDTGATGSVITEKVVDQCVLKPTGMTDTRHADGEVRAEVYRVNILLPNNVAFSNVRVTKLRLAGSDALIGMDIMNQGDFAVTNTEGQTVFSFQIPSIQRIDFVKAAIARNPAKRSTVKVERNDPCPCGSGRKFKNCCGRAGS